jgi:glycerophosphoryl diester phosphodiesterase
VGHAFHAESDDRAEDKLITKDWKKRLLLAAALVALFLSLSSGATAQWREDDDRDGERRSTAEDFLRLKVGPIAIGHHGVGPYATAQDGLPIENTVESVREAYREGARVVEVDVQLTADGKLAVYHDDFLSDFTCLQSLTLEQLQARLPYVPELRDVLKVARQVNRENSDRLDGILIVELKAFSPHCDPDDVFEKPLVAAAVREARDARMTRQVILDSFSPALLFLASQAAPEIPRELDLDGLQLLNPDQIEAVTGLPVTIINKKISLGLTWADIGPVYRLPGYASPGQFLAIAMAVQARAIGGEMDFLGAAEQQEPGSGAAFVAGAHSLGLRAFADPANVEADWDFFASLGVDAIYSTIPMGVNLEPAIPEI